MSWTVGSVMTRDVVTVRRETSYKEVAESLHEKGVSAVPVVDAGNRVVGVVSEADLLLKEERPGTRPGGPLLDPHGNAAKALARNAAALMTSPAVTILSNATLSEAARLMHSRKVKRLPVVDADGRLVGIVSRADLIQVFIRSDDSIASEVRSDVAEKTLMLEPEALTISVRDGIVRLEGELETRSLARILVRLVRAVEGVVGVDDRLRWKLDDSDLRAEMSPLAVRLAADERE